MGSGMDKWRVREALRSRGKEAGEPGRAGEAVHRLSGSPTSIGTRHRYGNFPYYVPYSIHRQIINAAASQPSRIFQY